MTKDEALKLVRDWIAERPADRPVSAGKMISIIDRALAQPAQEAASIIQAVTDPENQPSQYGTVTLDYHLAKIKEWEDRFERISDLALAQPAQEPVAYIDVEQRRLQWAKPMSWNTPTTVNLPKIPLYTAPPQPEERNFCPRCGKRTADLTTIHTCTPPQENT